MPNSSYLSLLLWSCALALPGLALAQQRAPDTRPDTVDVPGYRETIQEAVSEHDAHNYVEARALFARANKLYPNARTLRGLGAVSFELQQYSESVSFLEQALASNKRPLEGKLREDTERLLVRARGFVAELQIKLQPSQVHVLIDGSDQPQPGAESIRIDVGTHELEFKADGYRSERRRVSVEGGETKLMLIVLQRDATAGQPLATPAPPVAPQVPTSRGDRLLRGIGGGLLGLGLGAFAGATVLSVKRHNRASDFKLSVTSTDAYVDTYSAWHSARTAPYVFGTISSTLLTAGSLMVLFSAERDAFPWWASSLSSVAGIGLAAWGFSDVAQGSTDCATPLDLRLCADKKERLDRGALVAMSALPLLVVPITQLVRYLVAPYKRANTSFMVLPDAAPQQRSLGLQARLSWL